MPTLMRALNEDLGGVKAIRCIISNSVSPDTVRFRRAQAKEKMLLAAIAISRPEAGCGARHKMQAR